MRGKEVSVRLGERERGEERESKRKDKSKENIKERK
jgi:hypothetical protein